jgi:hypothetical protein
MSRACACAMSKGVTLSSTSWRSMNNGMLHLWGRSPSRTAPERSRRGTASARAAKEYILPGTSPHRMHRPIHAAHRATIIAYEAAPTYSPAEPSPPASRAQARRTPRCRFVRAGSPRGPTFGGHIRARARPGPSGPATSPYSRGVRWKHLGHDPAGVGSLIRNAVKGLGGRRGTSPICLARRRAYRRQYQPLLETERR